MEDEEEEELQVGLEDEKDKELKDKQVIIMKEILDKNKSKTDFINFMIEKKKMVMIWTTGIFQSLKKQSRSLPNHTNLKNLKNAITLRYTLFLRLNINLKILLILRFTIILELIINLKIVIILYRFF